MHTLCMHSAYDHMHTFLCSYVYVSFRLAVCDLYTGKRVASTLGTGKWTTTDAVSHANYPCEIDTTLCTKLTAMIVPELSPDELEVHGKQVPGTKTWCEFHCATYRR
jgi:hypothetical protein